MFAFAGLWDRWIDPQGKDIESYTIITTTPNSHLADIHDRMPVILPSGAYASWLNPAMRDSRTALGWLVPYGGAMRRYAVTETPTADGRGSLESGAVVSSVRLEKRSGDR